MGSEKQWGVPHREREDCPKPYHLLKTSVETGRKDHPSETETRREPGDARGETAQADLKRELDKGRDDVPHGGREGPGRKEDDLDERTEKAGNSERDDYRVLGGKKVVEERWDYLSKKSEERGDTSISSIREGKKIVVLIKDYLSLDRLGKYTGNKIFQTEKGAVISKRRQQEKE